MQNLLLAAEVVVPLLVLLAVGALVRACGIVDAATLTRVNRLIVYVALPSKCLLSLSESDLSRRAPPSCCSSPPGFFWCFLRPS